MMKTRIFAITICLLAFVSCRPIIEPEFKGINGINLNRLSMKDSRIQGNIVCYNPNRFQAKLKTASGKIWLEENYLGEFSLDSLIVIQPQSDFEVPVTMLVDVKNILKSSLPLLLRDSLTVRIEGTARVGKGAVYKTFPVTYTGKQTPAYWFNGQ